MKHTFAKHPPAACWLCAADRPDLCAALGLFLESGGCERHWKVLRGRLVPGSRGIVGRTVWQIVCEYAGITDIRGGRYQDGGEVPAPELVLAALLTGTVATA